MKKKVFSTILSLVCALICALSLAACGDGGGGTDDEKTYGTEGLAYEYRNGGYVCTGIGTATDEDIVIPSEYKGELVIEIGNRAFYGLTNIKSVVIPDTVGAIDDFAFANSAITSLSLTRQCSIRLNAFLGCPVKTATVNSNVIEHLHKPSLETLTIANGVVERDTLAGCTSLTSVTISDEIQSVDSRAFDDCPAVKRTENGVAYVDKWAVGCDANATSASLLSNTKGIADYAFTGCASLTGMTIPDGVVIVGAHAFDGCAELVQNDNSILYVGNWAVGYELEETSVIIRENTKAICNGLFDEHKTLESLTIPSSVTSIGVNALTGCRTLENVYYLGDVAEWCAMKGPGRIRSGTTLYINGSKVEGELVIPNGVTNICYCAFYGCREITSVSIPNSVTAIGDGAFRNCHGLTSLTVPSSVTSIGHSTFRGCDSLETITINVGIKSIGNFVFADCTALTSITFNGTKAQWEAIEKGNSWNLHTGDYTIHCSDGDIADNQ